MNSISSIIYILWWFHSTNYFALAQIFWDHFKLSALEFPKLKDNIYFDTQTDLRTLCIYDLISIQWSTSYDPIDHSIAFTVDSSGDITYGSLVLEKTWSQKKREHVIKCGLEHEYCTVGVDTARLENGKLIVKFDKDTNEPPLDAASLIKDALTIRPYLNDTALGEWTSPGELEITTSESYINAIIASAQVGEFNVVIGPDPLGNNYTEHHSDQSISKYASGGTFEGRVSFRPVESGAYKVFIIHTTSRKLVSPVHKLSVQMCGESLPPPPGSRTALEISNRKHDNSKEEVVPPKPLVRYRGVVALSGKESAKGITIPHKALPRQGSWSISMWLKLLEGPTGSFRSLFYKGDGQDPNRTPSAWLLPVTSRLALRASIHSNMDLGADSLLDLPLLEWVHLTFVFQNLTTVDKPISPPAPESFDSSSNTSQRQAPTVKQGPYIISVYQNGNMDVSLTYPDNVLANEHPLQFFRDLSHRGPRGFAADIVVWDSALTEQQVKTIALTSSSADHRPLTDPIDNALNLVEGFLNIPTIGRSEKTRNTDEADDSESENMVHTDNIDDANTQELYEDQQAMTSTFKKDTWFDILPSEEIGQTPTRGFTAYDGKGSPLSVILTQIETALANCESPNDRLDLYAEASSYGHIESLYRWSMLLGFGSEIPNTSCGIESFQVPRNLLYHEVSSSKLDAASEKWSREFHRLSEGNVISDQVRSAVGLITAAQYGYTAALVPLSTMVATSVGVSGLLRNFHTDEGNALLAFMTERIPLPTSMAGSGQTDSDTSILVDFNRIADLTLVVKISDMLRREVFGSVDDGKTDLEQKTKNLKRGSSGAVVSSVASINQIQDPLLLSRSRAPPRDASPYEVDSARSVFALSMGVDKSDKSKDHSGDRLSRLASGLLHIAAADDNADAQVALFKRYQEGLGGLSKDTDMASHYASLSAAKASEEFHKVGAQPIMESDKITDSTELVIAKGNSGADDEHIQMLTVQAQEGDIPSKLSLGELYYYGSRGLPRDQVRSLELYSEAAAAGDPNGMCGAAGMLLKGEGGDKNVSRALALYDKAASKGSIRAFNGLGYVYFFGNGDEVPVNQTKAYQYFLRATEHGGDSDSWFNAGYCLEHGIGTTKDVARSATFYHKGATQFGHFDSVYALGNMHLQGKGVARSSKEALFFLKAANEVGPWAGWLRRGLNQYLKGQSLRNSEGYFERSLLCYLHAGELGYEVSVANSAFILRRKLPHEAKRRMIGSGLVLLDASTSSLMRTNGDDNVNMDQVSEYLVEGLLVRQLSISAGQGNAESAQLLGNHFLHTSGSTMFRYNTHSSHNTKVNSFRNKPDMAASKNQDMSYCSLDEDNDQTTSTTFCAEIQTKDRLYTDEDSQDRRKAALWWFARSSAMGNYMGSLQTGLMHHFGIGTPGGEINLHRAKRYYTAALNPDDKSGSEPMPYTIRMATKTLLWLVSESDRSSIAVQFVNSVLGYFARIMLDDSEIIMLS